MTAKRRNAYFALMGCGAAALLVDRVFLSESTPAQAVADEGRSNRPSTKPHHLAAVAAKAAASSASSAIASIPELPFPRNLPAFDPSSPIRDIFAPNALNESGNGSSPSSLRNNGHSGAVASAVEFVAKHRLDAVMLRNQLSIVVVDGTPMKDGDMLDGCRLVRISGTSVEFSCKSGSTILTLSKPFEKTRE